MPHGLGELPPGLALTASLCFPSVVSVGSATGPTAFPALVVEACVGGRLVARFALPLLTSAHGKTGLSNVQAGLEPKWLRMFCELVNKKVPNPLGNYRKFASGLVDSITWANRIYSVSPYTKTQLHRTAIGCHISLASVRCKRAAVTMAN